MNNNSQSSLKVEIVYADFGGGHRNVATALAEAINMLDTSCEVQIVDGLRQSSYPYYRITRIYPILVNQARWLYTQLYSITNGPSQIRIIESLLYRFTKKSIVDYLTNHSVDLFITCHPLFTLLLPIAIRSLGLSTKVISIITDPITPHAFNFSPNVDLCIVSSDAAKNVATKQKVAREKVKVYGHPISPNFTKQKGNRVGTLASLSLNPETAVALILGGGDGLGRIYETVCALSNTNIPIQLIVVCGRNTKLRTKLQKIKSRIAIRVLGFANNVSALMEASDLLIAKAGPSTIYEAFAVGIPIILYDAIWGQEAGNIELVVNNGAGMWCPSPQDIVLSVGKLINDQAQLDKMALSCLRLSDIEAAIRIAQKCISFAKPTFDLEQNRDELLDKSANKHTPNTTYTGRWEFSAIYKHFSGYEFSLLT